MCSYSVLSSPYRFISKSNGNARSDCSGLSVMRVCAAFVVACLMMAPIGCGSGSVESRAGGSGLSAAQLSVSSTNLNFGSVVVNAMQMQSVTLTSTGTTPVTVSSVTASGAGFTTVGGSFPITLNSAQTLTVQIQFNPTTSGPASGQLIISSNSTTGSTTVVNLVGTGVAGSSTTNQQLTVSAAGLSFGSVTVNTTTTQSLTLASTGTSPVMVNSAAVTGTGFSIVGTSLPVTLNPSQSVTLQVQFSPTTAGSAIGQLTINSNSVTGATAVVALSGTGAAANPQLAVSPGSLSFGNVAVDTGVTRSLMLTSTGTSPVTVNSAVITGAGFMIVASSLPVTLNPSQAFTLQVQFDPTATGTANGQITINSNSATGGTALVALGGTGTAANPQLTVGATNLSFGNVMVNTTTTQSLILTSTGTSAVTVNSAAITGAGFSILGGSFPVMLSPGQTLTIQVQFSPTATGAASGQIAISSNSASGGTALVALSGTSTAAAHEVDLSWDAPVSSDDPVAGYNVYRSTGSDPFVLINLSPDLAVVYVDSVVVSGASYSYFVTSVDSSGVESVASNQITVTIP